jgi:hypothetical protein
MKYLSLPALATVLFLTMVLTMQSCGPGKPGVYKNDQMSSGQRDKLHSLNNELFTAITANKLYDVEALLSREVLNDNSYKHTVDLMGIHNKKGYTTLDEFYIVNYKPTDTHTIPTKALDGTKYILNCKANTEEMYVAFFASNEKSNKWMAAVVYSKYDYGWKISSLQFDKYAMNGKNSAALYHEAKILFDKNYLLDAVNDMQLATSCARPNDFWQYPEEEDMHKFYSKLLGGINEVYKFPLVISEVDTKPIVFEVTHQTNDDGVFPEIYYLSKINVDDTTAVKVENEKVKKYIGQVFPGVDKDKKYIYFAVFNKRPTSSKETPSFDITCKLK